MKNVNLIVTINMEKNKQADDKYATDFVTGVLKSYNIPAQDIGDIVLRAGTGGETIRDLPEGKAEIMKEALELLGDVITAEIEEIEEENINP